MRKKTLIVWLLILSFFLSASASADARGIKERSVLDGKVVQMEFGAHRGAKAYAPMDSVVAYRIACELGFDWLWIAQVAWNAEGTFYCTHDWDISKATNAPTGTDLRTLTDKQVARYRCNRGSIQGYSNEELRICKLEEALQMANEHGTKLYFRIEKFPTSVENEADKAVWDRFAALLQKYGITNDRCAFSGLKQAHAMLTREYFGADAEISPFLGVKATIDKYLNYYMIGMSTEIKGPRSLIMPIELCGESELKTLHSFGIKVYLYSSTQSSMSAEQVRWCARNGVDAIQSGMWYYVPMEEKAEEETIPSPVRIENNNQ